MLTKEEQQRPTMTLNDLKIRDLKGLRLTGLLISTLGLLITLGFQLYHSLMLTTINPMLGVGSSVLIVFVVIIMPHATSGLAHLGARARWFITSLVLLAFGFTMIASYVSINRVFLEAEYHWQGAYLLPFAFDAAPLTGLAMALAASNQIAKIRNGLVEEEKALKRPQKPRVTVVEESPKPEPKVPQNRSEGRLKTPEPRKPLAIEEGLPEFGELSENQRKWLARIASVIEDDEERVPSIQTLRERMKKAEIGSGSNNTISLCRRVIVANPGLVDALKANPEWMQLDK